MSAGKIPPNSGDVVKDSAATGPADSKERTAERIALGHALDARADDIVRWCQLEFAKHSGATLDEVAAPQSGWETTSLAVHSIANWLKSGVSASFLDRERIASLGKAAARPRGGPPPPRPKRGPPPRKTGLPPNSVPPLNLWAPLIRNLTLWG